MKDEWSKFLVMEHVEMDANCVEIKSEDVVSMRGQLSTLTGSQPWKYRQYCTYAHHKVLFSSYRVQSVHMYYVNVQL